MIVMFVVGYFANTKQNLRGRLIGWCMVHISQVDIVNHLRSLNIQTNIRWSIT